MVILDTTKDAQNKRVALDEWCRPKGAFARAAEGLRQGPRGRPGAAAAAQRAPEGQRRGERHAGGAQAEHREPPPGHARKTKRELANYRGLLLQR